MTGTSTIVSRDLLSTVFSPTLADLIICSPKIHTHHRPFLLPTNHLMLDLLAALFEMTALITVNYT